MTYKMLAVDMDGTLLQQDQSILAEDLQALQRAHDAGIQIIPCTGRSLAESREPLSHMDFVTLGVFCTGAMLIELPSEQTLASHPMPAPIVKEAVKRFAQEPEATLLFTNPSQTGYEYLVVDGRLTANTEWWFNHTGVRWTYRDSPSELEIESTLRISMVTNAQKADALGDHFKRLHHEHVEVHAFEAIIMDAGDPFHLVELFARGITKWSGLQQAAELSNINTSQIIGIGDQINDLPMLRHAGCGIAMGNAVEDAVQAARYQTRCNKDAGVAYAVDQILSGKW